MFPCGFQLFIYLFYDSSNWRSAVREHIRMWSSEVRWFAISLNDSAWKHSFFSFLAETLTRKFFEMKIRLGIYWWRKVHDLIISSWGHLYHRVKNLCWYLGDNVCKIIVWQNTFGNQRLSKLQRHIFSIYI